LYTAVLQIRDELSKDRGDNQKKSQRDMPGDHQKSKLYKREAGISFTCSTEEISAAAFILSPWHEPK